MQAGSRLGHYEILSAIGKGGMGEVYRARDTKLGRDVAVKLLPEIFVSDADRVSRLEREARLLAVLNHPNVAAIFGFEKSSNAHFIVLELVRGKRWRRFSNGGHCRLPKRFGSRDKLSMHWRQRTTRA
jgi:serine/threonine protein kinase